MKIRVILTDTGTGETATFDTDIVRVVPSLLTEKIKENWGDPGTLQCVALEAEHSAEVLQLNNIAPKVYGFLYRWRDDYFGYQLITGHIYTDFI